MFTLKITVADKFITEVLGHLKGIADTVKVEYEPGKLIHKPPSKANGQHYAKSMETVELLTMELHKRKLLEISGPELKKLVGGMGLPPSSYTYYIAGLTKAGVLKLDKKVGTAKVYRVTGK